jgi:hypothetical protein
VAAAGPVRSARHGERRPRARRLAPSSGPRSCSRRPATGRASACCTRTADEASCPRAGPPSARAPRPRRRTAATARTGG